MALLAFAALNVLTPSDVFAQNANDGGGTVSGVVTDDQGPVRGRRHDKGRTGRSYYRL